MTIEYLVNSFLMVMLKGKKQTSTYTSALWGGGIEEVAPGMTMLRLLKIKDLILMKLAYRQTIIEDQKKKANCIECSRFVSILAKCLKGKVWT